MFPAFFIPHGGGPWPLLGHVSQQELVTFLKSDSISKYKPKAIILISAHWEESIVTITGGSSPSLIYDYNNFPPEAYEIKYPAKGNPELANRVKELLNQNNIKSEINNDRGYDHGVFVPLKIIYPEADIPVIEISLLSSLNSSDHFSIGKALYPLRQEGILFIGSGMSFHNMAVFREGVPGLDKSKEFDEWLNKVCCESTPNERKELLENWSKGPHAVFCHPREEHLIPLMVIAGVANDDKGKNIFKADMRGGAVSGFQFGE
eukprot:c1624_g1_i2.p1 GENE.c1624_g1_i2~~c1624_g1_i2.p1  ORF type:complete len:262 (+),score=110.52 c1624_g1_i2:39-824(+)